METGELIEKCRRILDAEWALVCSAALEGSLADYVPKEHLRGAIHRSVNSKTKTYRYVLPTQLLAKLADAALDARCLQASRGGAGAFDARTIAHKVVVPFDQANERVLGGSAEPYVSNPLRVPEISPAHKKPIKNQRDWDDLCHVLEYVEENRKPKEVLACFRQVLKEVFHRLETVHVVFPIPTRASFEDTLKVVSAFVSEKSGGDRFEAITAALFDALGKEFGLFQSVRRAKVTAADASSGMLADIECLDANAEIVLVVEAKDRALTITQMKDRIPGLRENRVTEAFFVAGKGVRPNDEVQVQELIRQEYVSGQNIYVTTLTTLCNVLFALLGEAGRRTFLECVCDQLNEFSDVSHRRAWAQLLATI